MNEVNSKIRNLVRTIILMVVLVGYQQEAHALTSTTIRSNAVCS